MVILKRGRTGSWFDHEDSRRLSAALTDRLRKRLAGRKCLFLTLTYDRSQFQSARDCYSRQSSERHVREFIRRLERAIGVSLKGRWIRKLEWQEAGGEGWPHFHVILDYPERIPHDVLASTWGWGFAHVRRVLPVTLRYFAKYVAKGSGAPGWLMYERPKAIKVIATSPGFWGDVEQRERGPQVKRPQQPWYVPLGVVLENRAGRVVASSADSKQHRTFKISMSDALAVLELHAARFWFDERGRVVARSVAWRRVVEVLAAASAASPRALHLRGTSNPHTEVPGYLLEFWQSSGFAEWRVAA